MLNFDKRIFFKITFLVSLITLASAYFIEYVLGHQPCNLCLIERIPYVGALIIIIINHKFNHLEKYLIINGMIYLHRLKNLFPTYLLQIKWVK